MRGTGQAPGEAAGSFSSFLPSALPDAWKPSPGIVVTFLPSPGDGVEGRARDNRPHFEAEPLPGTGLPCTPTLTRPGLPLLTLFVNCGKIHIE